MTLSPVKREVLDEIRTRVSDHATWCLFGSTDTVLRGLDDDPNDIDILATEEAAEEFRAKFADDFVDTRELGYSQIDTYEVGGEELEVIFSRDEKPQQEPLIDLSEVSLETSDDPAMPLLPLDSLVRAYRKIEKHETADRLESELDVKRK
ncbi:hypothetical protein A4G99_21930 [Haladaptatus sp. R4]|uniref:hypothetical protein n=1 Tax=Haladaptatus sp. R4 TaxID=1679489 RepID=UPI0007B4EFCE|nr:hypothetical protein [Haladaptatus sp. R4]KZN26272.1 hypothetical protein A4G99_21930 [Haladaptatus sp. R4]